SRPRVDRLAVALRRVLPTRLAYRVTRWKNTTLQQLFYRRARSRPAEAKQYLVGKVAEALPDVDVERHFTPSYDPRDQRVCLVPDGDLFDAIRAGNVAVVTDRIDHVDDAGIALAAGARLDADIIITATGLELVSLGEIAFTVDGAPVDISQTWTYKGLAYSDVPNLASSFGYVNASWTLRTDLICAYVCRLLEHMERTGTRVCVPRLRATDAGMPTRPWIDGFTPGYLERFRDRMPRQGDREPWINPQNYARDRKLFARSPVDDGVMQFS
ncbi:MAG: FAD-containing monooxygenase EthA, partial [Actinomycetota bacterium]